MGTQSQGNSSYIKAHKKENSYGLVNSEDNYSHNEKQMHLHYYQCKHTQYFLII